MMKEKGLIVAVLRCLVGAVFIVSGFAKAQDSAYFAQIIGEYGLGNFPLLAPVIIMVEVLLGLALVVQYRPQLMVWATIVFTVGLTCVYSYGLAFRGITDCGCFGHMQLLSRTPWVVIGKNVVILALLAVALVLKGEVPQALRYNGSAATGVVACVLLVSVYAAFLSGKSYQKPRTYGVPVDIPLSQSDISKFLHLSPDSTYFVYVFSYSCPHCLNSIANVKEYAASNTVDKVIALALGDENAEEEFRQEFHPNFEIHNFGPELFELTSAFPKGYYVRRDTVKMETRGEMACHLIFRSVIEEIP